MRVRQPFSINYGNHLFSHENSPWHGNCHHGATIWQIEFNRKIQHNLALQVSLQIVEVLIQLCNSCVQLTNGGLCSGGHAQATHAIEKEKKNWSLQRLDIFWEWTPTLLLCSNSCTLHSSLGLNVGIFLKPRGNSMRPGPGYYKTSWSDILNH